MIPGLPSPIYLTIADFGADGYGNGGDFTETLDAAADQLADAERMTRRDAYVIRIDLPEGVATDATQAVLAVITARTRGRHLEAAE